MLIKRLRFDREMEFLKEEMAKWIKEEGKYSEPTAPYRPDQNGLAERANRTVIERMRAIFIETNLPKSLWPLVFDATLYIKNRTPSIAISDYTVLVMYWTSKTPDLSRMHPIGSSVVYRIPDAKRVKSEKFEAGGVKCRFLGYEVTNYRLWNGSKVIISSDVAFVKERTVTKEETTAQHNLPEDIFGDELDGIPVNIHSYDPEKRSPGAFMAEVDVNNADVSDISVDYDKEQDVALLPIKIPTSGPRDLALDPRPTRLRQPPKHFRDEQAHTLFATNDRKDQVQANIVNLPSALPN